MIVTVENSHVCSLPALGVDRLINLNWVSCYSTPKAHAGTEDCEG